MSFLLDTVTLSSLRDANRCDTSVLNWAKSHRNTEFFISVITLNEIQFGIRKVERHDSEFAEVLTEWYEKIVSQNNNLPALAVDSSIARIAAVFRYDFRMSHGDSLIAATVRVHGLRLATRNVSDFDDCGIAVENPWTFRNT